MHYMGCQRSKILWLWRSIDFYYLYLLAFLKAPVDLHNAFPLLIGMDNMPKNNMPKNSIAMLMQQGRCPELFRITPLCKFQRLTVTPAIWRVRRLFPYADEASDLNTKVSTHQKPPSMASIQSCKYHLPNKIAWGSPLSNEMKEKEKRGEEEGEQFSSESTLINNLIFFHISYSPTVAFFSPLSFKT